jgi:hypothetical protein
LGNTSKTITDGAWVEFAGDLVVPDCALGNVGLWLEGPGAGVDLYIDHVSIRPQQSPNIVANGTFESGTSGWYTWEGGAQLGATTTRAHGGTSSLLVSNRTSGPAATELTAAIKAGTIYPFSLWVSAQTTANSDPNSQGIKVTQAVKCQENANTTYSQIGGPVTVPDGGTWAQITGTVTVPNCTVTQVQFYVEGAIGSDLYLDDVQVIDNSLVGNLISDGSFESGQGAWGGWGYTTLAVTNTTAHSGTQSLLATGMSQYGAIARDIRSLVAPGKKYQASAWVSVASLSAPGAVKFQTVQRCNGASGDSYPWLAGGTVANGAWIQLAGTVDLSACTTIENLVLFVGADSGDLLVDDVVLTALP